MAEALANVEMEAALLGALMFDNRLIERASDIVAPADFCEPAHGVIFAALAQQAALGRPANAMTIRAFCEGNAQLDGLGGVRYLAGISGDLQGVFAPLELAAMLKDLSRRRMMKAGLNAAARSCEDPESDIAQIIAEADAAISVHEGRSGIVEMSAGQALDDLIAGFSEPADGVLCHQIPELDDLLGPLRPKQLIVVGARPGMGKTALALSYAIGAAKAGHGVLFVSLEMASRELAARMLADLCFDGQDGVPYGAIRDGRLNDWQKKRVAQVSSAAVGLPLKIIDAGSLTVGRLDMLVRRHARRMAAKGEALELVVVDYLQLLRADGHSKSIYEATSEVSRTLKAIAKDQNVVVMALAQLSREAEKRTDKRPQLSDLRDSGQIEQDADAVLLLLREEYYLRQSLSDAMVPKNAEVEHALSKVQGQIEFILAKRRSGVTGAALGQFHGAHQAVR